MLNGRRQPSRGGTSRMTRECQVRFCERLGVKFPGTTRQNENPPFWGLCQLLPATDTLLHRGVAFSGNGELARLPVKNSQHATLQRSGQGASRYFTGMTIG